MAEGPAGCSGRVIHVERTGPLVTVQDLGRPGRARLGVSRSGAADRTALRRANRLLGNAERVAGLEVLVGGLEVRAGCHLVVAVSGATGPLLLDGRAAARESVLDLDPGSRLVVLPAVTGVRAYLAVRGGIDVPPVLGSRSRDTLAALGPEPVGPGDVLPVGEVRFPNVVGWPLIEALPVPAPPDPEDVVLLRAVPGPRADWLDDAARAALRTVTWEVDPASDRVGVRLRGPALGWAASRQGVELPSEGLVRGAVQVPPSGQPVVFLADHPVTGGYPVVSVVLDADADRLGQLRPGQRVRLLHAI